MDDEIIDNATYKMNLLLSGIGIISYIVYIIYEYQSELTLSVYDLLMMVFFIVVFITCLVKIKSGTPQR